MLGAGIGLEQFGLGDPRFQRLMEAIRNAIRCLELTPFSFRKAIPGNPFLREVLIPFGASGYVAPYEIDHDGTVTILAVRHQREDDYH